MKGSGLGRELAGALLLRGAALALGVAAAWAVWGGLGPQRSPAPRPREASPAVVEPVPQADPAAPGGQSERAAPEAAPPEAARPAPVRRPRWPSRRPGPAAGKLPGEAARATPPAAPGAGGELSRLRARLLLPLPGIGPDDLVDSFDDARGASRTHEALDIAAPRNTPVLAVDDGVIARLFESEAGGITVYQFDPSETFTYYYAHLERYRRGLEEGERVRRGEVIGYVGTTGNAPPDVPHLHFAIYRLGPEKRWWEGEPINPFAVYGTGD